MANNTSHRTLALLSVTCLSGLMSCTQVETGERVHEGSMLQGLEGWQVTPLVTVGERTPSTDLDSSHPNYQPVGSMDGLGAYKRDDSTVRVLVNHELAKEGGHTYQLKNETRLRGARVSFFDIDRITRKIVNSGVAYNAVRDRQMRVVTGAAQINEAGQPLNGFSRLCSANLIPKGAHGFRDTIFFTNEEAADPIAHPWGGSLWALEVENHTLHAIPAAGRMAWENTAPLSIGADSVGLLIGNDSIPQSDEPDKHGQKATSSTPLRHLVTAPLWLYLGKKNASLFEIREQLPVAQLQPTRFLNRNGLLVGELFYFVSNDGMTSVEHFKGTGSVIQGRWEKISVWDRSQAGKPGFDKFGYKNGFTLRREAKAGGAFQFSRPEDVSTHPSIGTRAVFSSTGSDSVFPDHEAWGTIYQVDVDIPTLEATIRILYDGDDAGRQFTNSDFGIRNPDNVEWSEDGFLYIQEDNAKKHSPLFGNHSGEEASIWRLHPGTGTVQRIAQVNRTVVLPEGSTDEAPDILGKWESSGILDVTSLFETKVGVRLLLATVQAHSVRDGMIEKANLVEAGQLVFLEKHF